MERRWTTETTGSFDFASATSPSLSSAETSLLASLAGVSDPPEAASAFFSNKGDVTGVFIGLGILALSIVGIVYVRGIRKRQYLKKRKSQDTSRSKVSVTFSTLMRRLDSNQTSESHPKVAVLVERTVTRSPPQSPPRRISISSLSEWWIRRRERRASQLQQVRSSSHAPSVIDDVKQETQWTLGKALEDQRGGAVTPPSPASLLPITQQHSTRLFTRGPSSKTSRWSRGGRSVAESEGGYFTLEDALSSLHVVYELGSSRSGRHPYARA